MMVTGDAEAVGAADSVLPLVAATLMPTMPKTTATAVMIGQTFDVLGFVGPVGPDTGGIGSDGLHCGVGWPGSGIVIDVLPTWAVKYDAEMQSARYLSPAEMPPPMNGIFSAVRPATPPMTRLGC